MTHPPRPTARPWAWALLAACALAPAWGACVKHRKDHPGLETPPAGDKPTPDAPKDDKTDGAPPADCLAGDVFDEKAAKRVTAFDQLALAGVTPVSLRVKVETRNAIGVYADEAGTDVRVTAKGFDVSAKTDSQGLAVTTGDMPAALTPRGGADCYDVDAAGAKARGRVFFWPPDEPILVSDIDQVLSDLSELKVPFTANAATPTLPDAAASLTQLARKYRIVYLTARDDALFNKTRAWLRENNFPMGPLFVWNWTAANKFGASRDEQRIFKTAMLKALSSSFSHVAVGVGNLPHDARAYLDAGLKAYVISQASDGFPANTVVVRSWADIVALEKP